MVKEYSIINKLLFMTFNVHVIEMAKRLVNCLLGKRLKTIPLIILIAQTS